MSDTEHKVGISVQMRLEQLIGDNDLRNKLGQITADVANLDKSVGAEVAPILQENINIPGTEQTSDKGGDALKKINRAMNAQLKLLSEQSQSLVNDFMNDYEASDGDIPGYTITSLSKASIKQREKAKETFASEMHKIEYAATSGLADSEREEISMRTGDAIDKALSLIDEKYTLFNKAIRNVQEEDSKFDNYVSGIKKTGFLSMIDSMGTGEERKQNFQQAAEELTSLEKITEKTNPYFDTEQYIKEGMQFSEKGKESLSKVQKAIEAELKSDNTKSEKLLTQFLIDVEAGDGQVSSGGIQNFTQSSIKQRERAKQSLIEETNKAVSKAIVGLPSDEQEEIAERSARALNEALEQLDVKFKNLNTTVKDFQEQGGSQLESFISGIKQAGYWALAQQAVNTKINWERTNAQIEYVNSTSFNLTSPQGMYNEITQANLQTDIMTRDRDYSLYGGAIGAGAGAVVGSFFAPGIGTGWGAMGGWQLGQSVATQLAGIEDVKERAEVESNLKFKNQTYQMVQSYVDEYNQIDSTARELEARFGQKIRGTSGLGYQEQEEQRLKGAFGDSLGRFDQDLYKEQLTFSRGNGINAAELFQFNQVNRLTGANLGIEELYQAKQFTQHIFGEDSNVRIIDILNSIKDVNLKQLEFTNKADQRETMKFLSVPGMLFGIDSPYGRMGDLGGQALNNLSDLIHPKSTAHEALLFQALSKNGDIAEFKMKMDQGIFAGDNLTDILGELHKWTGNDKNRAYLMLSDMMPNISYSERNVYADLISGKEREVLTAAYRKDEEGNYIKRTPETDGEGKVKEKDGKVKYKYEKVEDKSEALINPLEYEKTKDGLFRDKTTGDIIHVEEEKTKVSIDNLKKVIDQSVQTYEKSFKSEEEREEHKKRLMGVAKTDAEDTATSWKKTMEDLQKIHLDIGGMYTKLYEETARKMGDVENYWLSSGKAFDNVSRMLNEGVEAVINKLKELGIYKDEDSIKQDYKNKKYQAVFDAYGYSATGKDGVITDSEVNTIRLGGTVEFGGQKFNSQTMEDPIFSLYLARVKYRGSKNSDTNGYESNGEADKRIDENLNETLKTIQQSEKIAIKDYHKKSGFNEYIKDQAREQGSKTKPRIQAEWIGKEEVKKLTPEEKVVKAEKEPEKLNVQDFRELIKDVNKNVTDPEKKKVLLKNIDNAQRKLDKGQAFRAEVVKTANKYLESTGKKGFTVKPISEFRTVSKNDSLKHSSPVSSHTVAGGGKALDIGIYDEKGNYVPKNNSLYKEVGQYVKKETGAKWGGDFTSNAAYEVNHFQADSLDEKSETPQQYVNPKFADQFTDKDDFWAKMSKTNKTQLEKDYLEFLTFPKDHTKEDAVKLKDRIQGNYNRASYNAVYKIADNEGKGKKDYAKDGEKLDTYIKRLAGYNEKEGSEGYKNLIKKMQDEISKINQVRDYNLNEIDNAVTGKSNFAKAVNEEKRKVEQKVEAKRQTKDTPKQGAGTSTVKSIPVKFVPPPEEMLTTKEYKKKTFPTELPPPLKVTDDPRNDAIEQGKRAKSNAAVDTEQYSRFTEGIDRNSFSQYSGERIEALEEAAGVKKAELKVAPQKPAKQEVQQQKTNAKAEESKVETDVSQPVSFSFEQLEELFPYAELRFPFDKDKPKKVKVVTEEQKEAANFDEKPRGEIKPATEAVESSVNDRKRKVIEKESLKIGDLTSEKLEQIGLTEKSIGKDKLKKAKLISIKDFTKEKQKKLKIKGIEQDELNNIEVKDVSPEKILQSVKANRELFDNIKFKPLEDNIINVEVVDPKAKINKKIIQESILEQGPESVKKKEIASDKPELPKEAPGIPKVAESDFDLYAGIKEPKKFKYDLLKLEPKLAEKLADIDYKESMDIRTSENKEKYSQLYKQALDEYQVKDFLFKSENQHPAIFQANEYTPKNKMPELKDFEFPTKTPKNREFPSPDFLKDLQPVEKPSFKELSIFSPKEFKFDPLMVPTLEKASFEKLNIPEVPAFGFRKSREETINLQGLINEWTKAIEAQPKKDRYTPLKDQDILPIRKEEPVRQEIIKQEKEPVQTRSEDLKEAAEIIANRIAESIARSLKDIPKDTNQPINVSLNFSDISYPMMENLQNSNIIANRV